MTKRNTKFCCITTMGEAETLRRARALLAIRDEYEGAKFHASCVEMQGGIEDDDWQYVRQELAEALYDIGEIHLCICKNYYWAVQDGDDQMACCDDCAAEIAADIAGEIAYENWLERQAEVC